MKKLLFIYNPVAGNATIKTKLSQIIDILTKGGFFVTVYPTQCSGDATEIIRKTGNQFDRIVCAGGDGTLDETITGLMEIGYQNTMGYIPCGTTNDYAKSLGLSTDPLKAAECIVNGEPYNIDIGCFMNRYFVYVASFGAFTDISYITSQKTKQSFGHAAYVLEGVKSLPNIQPHTATIEYDGNKLEKDTYILSLCTNSLSVGGFKHPSNNDILFDDGKFEILLVKAPQNLVELQSILNAYLLSDFSESHFLLLKASEYIVRSEDPIPWCLDGEKGGDHKEVHIKIKKKALSIMRERA